MWPYSSGHRIRGLFSAFNRTHLPYLVSQLSSSSVTDFQPPSGSDKSPNGSVIRSGLAIPVKFNRSFDVMFSCAVFKIPSVKWLNSSAATITLGFLIPSSSLLASSAALPAGFNIIPEFRSKPPAAFSPLIYPFESISFPGHPIRLACPHNCVIDFQIRVRAASFVVDITMK